MTMDSKEMTIFVSDEWTRQNIFHDKFTKALNEGTPLCDLTPYMDPIAWLKNMNEAKHHMRYLLQERIKKHMKSHTIFPMRIPINDIYEDISSEETQKLRDIGWTVAEEDSDIEGRYIAIHGYSEDVRNFIRSGQCHSRIPR